MAEVMIVIFAKFGNRRAGIFLARYNKGDEHYFILLEGFFKEGAMKFIQDSFNALLVVLVLAFCTLIYLCTKKLSRVVSLWRAWLPTSSL
jgi:hypothetical protein